jgi:hypothetical protein
MYCSPAVYLGSIRTELGRSIAVSKPRAKPLPVRQDRDSGARKALLPSAFECRKRTRGAAGQPASAMDAGAPRLPATRGLTAHYFFTFECAPGTAARLRGGELRRLGFGCEHRQARQDVPVPAAPLLQAWRSCQCKSRPRTLSVRLAHPAAAALQTAGCAWRSVQQRVLHEGDTGGASWSAWLLCSLSREPSTPERRVVQLDVKRRRLVVLCKAAVKHTFQARRAPALRRDTWGQGLCRVPCAAPLTRIGHRLPRYARPG